MGKKWTGDVWIKGKVTGWWRKLHNESFVICVLSQILIGLSNIPIQSE
jgi:hypothetical protein